MGGTANEFNGGLRLTVIKLTQGIGEPVEVFPCFTMERICQTASRASDRYDDYERAAEF